MPNVHLHRSEVSTKLRGCDCDEVGLARGVLAQAVVDVDSRGMATGLDSQCEQRK